MLVIVHDYSNAYPESADPESMALNTDFVSEIRTEWLPGYDKDFASVRMTTGSRVVLDMSLFGACNLLNGVGNNPAE